MNIAILGATGHIAKNLIYYFKDEPDFTMYLFTRSIERTTKFVNDIGMHNAIVNSYDEFYESNYSGIINCVGIGDQNRLKENPGEVFFVTEEIDLLVLSYLNKYPTTCYINFSSGAIYGTEFSQPVQNSSVRYFAVNDISLSDYYGIAKINAEAKHRALKNFNIIDLRIFGFYSPYIELDRPYLLSEVVRALKSNQKFLTSSSNIVRDYIHPTDLFELVKLCLLQENLNTSFDVCSKKPVTKFDILEFFRINFNFEYEISTDNNITSITGNKDNYFSESRKTMEICFEPKYSSLDCISDITYKIIQQ